MPKLEFFLLFIVGRMDRPHTAQVALSQSLGNYGSLRGVVLDASKASVPGATVLLRNPLTGVQRTTSPIPQGAFQLNGIPFGNYRLTASAPGFQESVQSISIGSPVPVDLNISLAVAGASTSVEVTGAAGVWRSRRRPTGRWTAPCSTACRCKIRPPASARW